MFDCVITIGVDAFWLRRHWTAGRWRPLPRFPPAPWTAGRLALLLCKPIFCWRWCIQGYIALCMMRLVQTHRT